MRFTRATLFAAVFAALASLGGPSQAATIELRVLETTDIHTNIMDFDY
ncbi:hypothetical protein [Endozoicomonas sp. 8E]|nr:hypothetical protein [Endozoicomonas sp. 8E]WOG28099.1 hypothetical protein P6910_00130 [Endozoicomonas sp. 8E]